MATSGRKPVKICPSDRTRSHGIVVADLKELKEKACRVFNYSPRSCRVVLDSDGTEVDDEEYFQFLKDDVKLMIIPKGGMWHSLSDDSQEESSQDEDEIKEGLTLDKTDGGEIFPHHLISRIKRDPAFFVSFKIEDLHSVIKMTAKGLGSLLHRPVTLAQHYIDASQQELDRRMQTQEATELMKLLKRAAEQSSSTDSRKRKRVEPLDDD